MLSLALLVLCSLAGIQNANSEPSYQVFLYKRSTPGGLLDRKCFGNIIQSHVILTAASCLLSGNRSSSSRDLLNPADVAVSVKGKDFEDLIYFVSEITVYPQFNKSTLDHDIALLVLNAQLPLADREDLEWILLADFDVTREFAVENGVSPFDADIEVYPGYGITQESNLIGIVTPDTRNGLQNRILSISPYLNWIYGILQEAELSDMQSESYSISLPYRQKKSTDQMNENIETEAGYYHNSSDKIKNNISFWTLIFIFNLKYFFLS
ncbi:uncharacterized protein Dana_GF14120 [Drosophila ananassae]|uniref:Peptidase S1 domain-containing protein n=1 Tax=Drosophila ananassae TaxID=7217 RepID=B3MPQ0_DROAN|nr:uncharacterized protein Dana_GF14120 [Drosophila ananassae]